MRDLPSEGDEFAAWPPGDGSGRQSYYPAQPRVEWGHPPEIAHQPAGIYGDADESVPDLTDWAGDEQEDWPGDSTSAPGTGTALGGPGKLSAFCRPGRRWTRAPSWFPPVGQVVRAVRGGPRAGPGRWGRDCAGHYGGQRF